MLKNQMKLYDYFRSSAAYRVRIALNIKKLPYTAEVINLLEKTNRSAAYLGLNPAGRVPTLQVSSEDGDRVENLTQSLAICEYLDEAYPDTARLLPSTALDRAHVRAMAQIIACDIHPLNNLSVLNYLKSELLITEDAKNKWYHHWIHQGFLALEQLVEKQSKFCFGSNVTLADICLVPQMYNARRFQVDLTNYPNLIEIDSALQEIEEFALAHPDRYIP